MYRGARQSCLQGSDVYKGSLGFLRDDKVGIQKIVISVSCMLIFSGVGLSLDAWPSSSQVLAAQIYYVDRNHPGANDGNAGTEDSPWRTIQHAADAAQPGDTIYVKAGTYDERAVVRVSGTPAGKITFQALPRRNVLMQGLYLNGADYIHIEGFRITNSLTGWTESSGFFVDGDWIDIVDNELFEIKDVAILASWGEDPPTNVYVADNRIYSAQMGIVIQGEGWIVENNEVERLFRYIDTDCDYLRFFGDNHIIRGNYFHGTNFNEVGSAHVDCFQIFDNNGEWAHNILVEGNICHDFHQGFMESANYYHNIDHITFRNNVFAHGGAWGICVENIPYVTVENNTFYDIYYHGVGFRHDSHDNVVVNNIFYDTGTSYWSSDGASLSGDNNIIFQSQEPGQAGPHDLIGVDPRLVDPANNDFHLQGSSPAVDAGQSLPQVTNDLEGKLRPQGAGYDIGAYEYGGSSQTFQDVSPEHWAHEFIEPLYQQGYIVGCSIHPRLYCPDRILNRAEEAVYVVRGVRGADFTPLNPLNPTFEDVGSADWYYDWSGQLYNDGYTSGCWADPLRYCPLTENTVAEGCVFFLRMKKGVDYKPDETIHEIFVDVPSGEWYAPWIEACYDEGILLPCQTEPQLLACPEHALDRALAARMMYMAKGLGK